MKQICYITILLFSLQFSRSYAQTDTLGILPATVWAHDTASFNDSVNVYITVINSGSNVYNDSLSIYAANQFGGSLDTLTIGAAGAVLINPDDTTGLGLNWIIESQKYMPGNNITVIWPSNPDNNNVIKDSLYLTTYVWSGSNVFAISPVKITVYPNPAAQVVVIGTSSKLVYDKLLVFDNQGRLVKRFDKQAQYDISALVNGKYNLLFQRKEMSVAHATLIISDR